MRKLRVIEKGWHERVREPGVKYAEKPLHYSNCRYLTVKEVAGTLRITSGTVLRLIAERKIWAQPSGNRYLIPEPALQDYFENERKRKLGA
jgi:excisionase family DNA binding protein